MIFIKKKEHRYIIYRQIAMATDLEKQQIWMNVERYLDKEIDIQI